MLETTIKLGKKLRNRGINQHFLALMANANNTQIIHRHLLLFLNFAYNITLFSTVLTTGLGAINYTK